jgi:hypothetical protein
MEGLARCKTTAAAFESAVGQSILAKPLARLARRLCQLHPLGRWTLRGIVGAEFGSSASTFSATTIVRPPAIGIPSAINTVVFTQGLASARPDERSRLFRRHSR